MVLMGCVEGQEGFLEGEEFGAAHWSWIDDPNPNWETVAGQFPSLSHGFPICEMGRVIILP